jgi:hypothetical protein
MDSGSQLQPQRQSPKNLPEAKAPLNQQSDALGLAREPQLQLPNRRWK